jgi:hypothetical protein
VTRQTTLDALQASLAAEHLAVYGYGIIGARLHVAAQRGGAPSWVAHRTRRDQLIGFIAALGAQPVAAQAAYRLPVGVTSTATAAQLAAVLEDAALAPYAALAGADDPKLRQFAAAAMQQTMTWRVTWTGATPAGAFPGLPQSALTPKP